MATGALSDPHLVAQEPLICTYLIELKLLDYDLTKNELDLSSASANLSQQATAGHTHTITFPLSLASQLISKAT